jgi:drug/metabolite transporter (DMT)-like permease
MSKEPGVNGIPPRQRALGIAAGAAIALVWGLSFLSIKVAVAFIPPMTLGLVRFIAATFILFFLKLRLAPGDKVRPGHFPALAAAGLVGVTLYFFMENNGVKLSTASEASVVVGAIPVLSMIAERIFLKTKLSASQYLGAACSTAGVWIFVSAGLSLSGGAGGYLYMSGAALSWVIYSFITRRLFDRHERITIVFWQSLFGTIGFLPFALAEAHSWRAAPTVVWLNVAYLAVFCSALGYWFYVYSVEALGMTASSVFINLIPVIAVLGGFAVLGDRMSALQWIGAAVVVGGVFLATRPRRESKV